MTELYDFEEKFLYTVVADSRRAKIFVKNIGIKSDLILISDILATHFTALHDCIDDTSRNNFGQLIAQKMNDLNFYNDDVIALIAPPKMMDSISKNSDSQILKKIVTKIPEDMVWMDHRDINRYLASVVENLGIPVAMRMLG
jgi:hypothetical protein